MVRVRVYLGEGWGEEEEEKGGTSASGRDNNTIAYKNFGPLNTKIK